MDSNTTPRKLLAQSAQVIRIWADHPECKMHNASLEEYRVLAREMQDTLDRIEDLKRELRLKATERDQCAERLNELTIRFRCFVTANLGTDSLEYALVGGTPASKRKKPGPKAGSKRVVAG